MIDERIEELVNADLDGRLSEGEHAELARAMLSDLDVRRLHDELRRLQARLQEVPPAEVPPEFLGSVMAALPRQQEQARESAASGGGGGWSWRHFAAMAAALGVVAMGLRLAAIGDRMDGSSAVGTMAVQDGSGSVRIDRPEVEGVVSLREAGGAVYADLDVVPHGSLEVVVMQGGKTIGRAGLEPAPADASRKVSLELSGEAGVAGPVVVRFVSEDRLVEEVSLALPVR